MSDKKPHKIIVYNWLNGLLQFEEKILSSLEQALAYIRGVDYYDVKVYAEDGQLVEVVKKNGIVIEVDTYASDTYA